MEDTKCAFKVLLVIVVWFITITTNVWVADNYNLTAFTGEVKEVVLFLGHTLLYMALLIGTIKVFSK